MKPVVSVVFPAYNEEKYIKKCLNSLLKQDFKEDYEIIIVNGDSTDKTERIIKSFKDKRIKLIQSSHHNTAENRNIGIKKAKGEYILQFTAHGIAEKNLLSTLVGRLRKVKDKSIVAVGCRHENPDDATAVSLSIGYVMESPFGAFGTTHIQADKEMIMDSIAFIVYRKSLHKDIGYFDPAFWVGQDAELNLRMRQKGYRMLYTPKTKVYHYKRTTHISHYRRMVKYGLARTKIIKKHPKTFKIIYTLPALFSLYVAVVVPLSIILSIVWNAACLYGFIPLAAYLLLTLANTTTITLKHGRKYFKDSFVATIGTHLGYGMGSIKGLS